jgi:hypothetical protein
MKKISIVPLLFLIILTGCFKERIIGSGTTISEKRTINDPFTEIRLEGSANVKIKQGDSIQVIAKDFPNILPYLRTTVLGNALVIDFQPDAWIVSSEAEVTVTLPKLKGLEITGSGDIGSISNFTCEDLAMTISGSGDISMVGKAKNLNAKVSGSGEIRTFDFICEDIIARISGSGNMNLNATKTLDAVISGSGDITYKGSPTVTSQITGSGRVRKF